MPHSRLPRDIVAIIGDIDRGGAFAALLGTGEWLRPDERALLRGFIEQVPRDTALVSPPPAPWRKRSSVPILGVVPHLADLVLPAKRTPPVWCRRTHPGCVDVIVVRLPHLANFDEFALLAAEPDVRVRYVTRQEEMSAPDLVILPGYQGDNTRTCCVLYERGLANRMRWLAEHGIPSLGICAGYQMPGTTVMEPIRIESDHTRPAAPGLMPVETELTSGKRHVQTRGRVREEMRGV